MARPAAAGERSHLSTIQMPSAMKTRPMRCGGAWAGFGEIARKSRFECDIRFCCTRRSAPIGRKRRSSRRIDELKDGQVVRARRGVSPGRFVAVARRVGSNAQPSLDIRARVAFFNALWDRLLSSDRGHRGRHGHPGHRRSHHDHHRHRHRRNHPGHRHHHHHQSCDHHHHRRHHHDLRGGVLR